MKQLVPLATPPSHLERYVAIRNRKKIVTRNVLIAHHAQIEARFDALAARIAAGDLETIGASTLLAISKELRLCYGSETKKLEELRAAIKEAQATGQLKYCPYCQTTLGGTDDHYLPAVLFPEFAVHPVNLVPACSTCNTTKGDAWLDGAGRRLFLQFFTDAIPAVDFLQVTLVTSPGVRSVGARFQLVQAGMSNADWELIRSHFDRLHLIERYEELGNDEIGIMLDSGRSHREAGGADVRHFLGLEAGKAERRFGRNHWRARILAALAAHPDVEVLTTP